MHAKDCCHEHRHQGLLGHLLSWKGFVFMLLAAAFSYYLLGAHQEHLAIALPYLILLACPLMHLFGHGHHHGGGATSKEGQDKP